MATRFTSQSVSLNGTTYTVAIDDTAFGASATEVEINGFQISYDPDSQDDPATPIVSSSCRFQINAVRNDTLTAVNNLIADMLDADEGRFRVKVTDGSSNIYWLGYVITDQMAIEDSHWADPVARFEIQAVDGISRLKDLDYNDAGTAYTGRELLIDHLFNILNKIGLFDFYGVSDTVLYSYCRWYENDMGAALTDHAFSLTYADHAAFYETDGEGNNTYTSCYDVLKQLSQLFLCRFYYSAGAYRLDQIKEYGQASVTTHEWDKSGGVNGATTATLNIFVENSDDLIRLGNVNGIYRYFAPARELKLSYKHVNDRNYFAGRSWTESTALATITQVGRDGVRLWVRGLLDHTPTFTPASNFRDCVIVFEFDIRATVGGTTYYLQRDYAFSNAGVLTYTDPAWTTTSTDRFHFVTTTVNTANGFPRRSEIDFETPDFPGSSEFADLSFDMSVESVRALNPGTAPDLVTATVTFLFWNVIVQLNSDDETALTETTVFSKTNGATPNASLVLEYDAIIGDSPSITFFTSSSLTIDNAGTEEASTLWAKGIGGGGKKIQQLWLDELMTLRNKSLVRYEGQILGTDYEFHEVWENIPNQQFIAQRVTYDSKSDTWAGEWWQVGTNRILDGSLANPVHQPGRQTGRIQGPPGPEPPGPVRPTMVIDAADPVFETVSSGGQAVAVTTAEVLGGGSPVTSISIEAIGNGCVIASGNTIAVYDPSTGETFEFTVTADVGGSDTTISVSSVVPTSDLSSGSYVVLDTGSLVSNIQGCIASSWYDEEFTVDNDLSVTVTVNGGTLPVSTAQLWVYYNGQCLPPTGNWSKSGSDITFTFRAFGNVYIRFVV